MTDYIKIALAAGFTPWGGGDAAPADWDGYSLLVRDLGAALGCRARWQHSDAPTDIIGYRKRTEQPADTVTIARMTEAEANSRADAVICEHYLPDHCHIEHFARALYRDLGLLAPETTAERFTRETGHEITPAVEAALAWERGK